MHMHRYNNKQSQLYGSNYTFFFLFFIFIEDVQIIYDIYGLEFNWI